jgi:hypothetical protein
MSMKKSPRLHRELSGDFSPTLTLPLKGHER